MLAMNRTALQQLSEKPFFAVADVARILGIQKESARVYCSRQVKAGLFIRMKKDFYISANKWLNNDERDFLVLANFIQVPSYISLMTALSFHGITTQVQRDWHESVSVKRSITYVAEGHEFHYHKLKKELYCGFEKVEGVFMARPEKALVDACHLASHGWYPRLDRESLNSDHLNPATVMEMASLFPERTQKMVRDLCRI